MKSINLRRSLHAQGIARLKLLGISNDHARRPGVTACFCTAPALGAYVYCVGGLQHSAAAEIAASDGEHTGCFGSFSASGQSGAGSTGSRSSGISAAKPATTRTSRCANTWKGFNASQHGREEDAKCKETCRASDATREGRDSAK